MKMDYDLAEQFVPVWEFESARKYERQNDDEGESKLTAGKGACINLQLGSQ